MARWSSHRPTGIHHFLNISFQIEEKEEFMEQTKKKRIAILGSTGSIGTQTLEVVKEHHDRFSIELLTANRNADLLIAQALEFKPWAVVIGDESLLGKVKEALATTHIQVFAGKEAITDLAGHCSAEIVVTAMVGYSGLKPTINAIKNGKDIALANKETLVVAGELIMGLVKEYGVKLLPVDSEHSAIYQCLVGEENNTIEKIYLTASGGPFFGKSYNFLENVTCKDALKHPNWDMGAKITIDSATLMNKGFEVIEAKWLFGLRPDQIEVVVHPQSIIHSMVQFQDSSIKAQLGLPDMKLPIQYALAFPERIPASFPRFSFMAYPNLSFFQPDVEVFRNLELAFQAMNRGGNMPCIINAANEVVVDAFLHDKISFLRMPEVIEEVMAKVAFVNAPNLADYELTDAETRRITLDLI